MKPKKKSNSQANAKQPQRTRSGMAARPIPAKKVPPARVNMMTIGEFADAWRVSQSHIASLIEEGVIVALDLSGPNASRRVWRIPVESYAQFVAGRVSLACVL
jgi:hypothetical protein